MKKLRSLVIRIALLGVLVANFGLPTRFVNAASAPSYSYSASIALQNLSSTSPANITITYYNQAGSPESTTVTYQIPAAGFKAYADLTTLASGFNGSGVVSSDAPIASIVNIKGVSSATTAWTSYIGMSTGDSAVYLPLLHKDNYGIYSWFNVQNLGTSTANVTATYSDGQVYTTTIAPNASKTFQQAAETHTGSVFSAKITSSQNIAVVVEQDYPKSLSAYQGFPATTAGTDPVFPLVNANNYGIITGIQLQNLGTISTTVTMRYTRSSDSSTCDETQTIQPGTSATFALYSLTYNPNAATIANGMTTTCVRGATLVGSARVVGNTGSQPLVGMANQDLPGIYGDTYGSFNSSIATNKVVFPLIHDRNYGLFSGISVMNVGSADTTVNCSFTGTSYTASKLLHVGESLVDVQLYKIASGYVGGATCIATGSGNNRIVGVTNQSILNATSDGLQTYEGINY